MIMKRRAIAASMIGGIPETQQMLDFCVEHGITADIELIRAIEINDADERMLNEVPLCHRQRHPELQGHL